MKRNLTCRNCGFVNNIEPEYNPEQENKVKAFSEESKVKLAEYDKADAQYKEIERRCYEANKQWKKVSNWKKFINEIINGATFRRFLAQNYSELCRLKDLELVWYIGSYIAINHDNLPYPAFPKFSDIPGAWNYSYTCENCGYVNRYLKKTVKG